MQCSFDIYKTHKLSVFEKSNTTNLIASEIVKNMDWNEINFIGPMNKK